MYLFWTNINTIFFCTHFGSPKKISLKTYEIMYGFGRKEHQRILHVVVLWAKVMLKMLFTCNNNNGEYDMNTRKHMILFHKKSSLIEKVLFKSIKQKAIWRQVSFFYLGEYVLRLAFSPNVLHRWTQRRCRTTLRSKFVSFKIQLSFPYPCWTIDAF